MDNNETERPNVLYVITHDQGIAASCYAKYGPCASSKMKTPNLDAVAQKGVMLTNHFGTAPQCSPARGSLITSMHPHVNGLTGLTHRGFEIAPENQKITIFQHFKKHGYFTKLVGFQHETEYDPKIIGYQEYVDKGNSKNCLGLLPSIEKSLLQMKEKSRSNQPTWLTIGITDIHLSWAHKTSEKDWYDPEKVEVPPFLPDTNGIRKHLGQLYAVLELYDEFVGELMSMVKKLGLDENTIIIFTTDHGIAHPRAKGTLYDPGNRDMMIFSCPKKFPAGKKVHSLLSSIDFAPTICELCGLPTHPKYMGNSYASLLTSEIIEETTEIHSYIFTEMTYHDRYNPMRAVRSERFKYIKNYEAEKVSLVDSIPGDIKMAPSYKEWVEHGTNTTRFKEEFFDLEKDPLEENNLLDRNGTIKNKKDERYREYGQKLYELKEALNDFLVETNDAILDGPYPPPKDVKTNNAKDFHHIPEKKLSTMGVFSKGNDGIPKIQTSYGSRGMVFLIPLGEILEEFAGEKMEIAFNDKKEDTDVLNVDKDYNISLGEMELTPLFEKHNFAEGDLIKIYVIKYSQKDLMTLIFEKMPAHIQKFY